MRWLCWISAVAFIAGPAWGADVAYDGVARYPSCGTSNCGSSRSGSWLYGNTSADCCECQPSPCDNAWASFCEENARWQAFWHQYGTPKPSTKRCWLPRFGRPTRADCQTCTTVIQSTDGIPAETIEIHEASPEQLSPEQFQLTVPPDPQASDRVAPLPPVPQPLPEVTTWRNAVWLR